MLLPYDTEFAPTAIDYVHLVDGMPEATVQPLERRAFDREFPIFRGLGVALGGTFGMVILGAIVAAVWPA